MTTSHNFPTDLDIYPSKPTLDAFTPSSADVLQVLRVQEDAIREYGIAGRIWEAAYALNAYLHPAGDVLYDPPFTLELSGNRLIELGSGTGLNAVLLDALLDPGRDVLYATDLPEVCPLLNQTLHSSKSVRVRPLAWGDASHALAIQTELNDQPLTHILCSDLVYFPHLLAPLLRSLIQLTSTSFGDPQIIISYRVRSLPKETPFWTAFGLWFEFAPVLTRSHSGWQRFGAELPDPTFVFIARRRKHSREWFVPDSDAALLSGVGAQGTSTPKGDDTFETLLFMSIGSVS
uniref:Uncharacterized protein n=1 Tax=Mycena chlorophos TaxID=658473 RepID=A0ABQ0L2A1_MYCCL|nr:predicted protein [Mycena chlorophos]